MNELPTELAAEIKQNLLNLRRYLESINNPELVVDDFAEGYDFASYEVHIDEVEIKASTYEFLTSFYRSIEVLQRGHPNLISAEESELENAYRTLIESALVFGESLIENGKLD